MASMGQVEMTTNSQHRPTESGARWILFMLALALLNWCALPLLSQAVSWGVLPEEIVTAIQNHARALSDTWPSGPFF